LILFFVTSVLIYIKTLVKNESNYKRAQNRAAIENRQQQPLVYKLEKKSVET